MNRPMEPLLSRLRDYVATTPGFSALGLPQLARPSVRLSTQPVSQDQIGLGESRIGGIPDFPPEFDWPRWMPSKQIDDKFGRPWHPDRPAPLGFIGQIDLKDVPRIDGSLPGSGWFYFFYDRYCEPWGFDPADRGCCRVLYADCDRSILKRKRPPADADPEHLAQACHVATAAQWTLPDYLDDVDYGTPIYEAYRKLCDELYESGELTHHHLLGYPQLIQNPMELECQLASNGIYCGNVEGYHTARAKELAHGASDWQLLLQIDTDEGPGWMWGDVGRIYFWIKRNDLASLRFDDVWLIFQCS